MSIDVVKADGTREPFKEEKLRTSLRRSGARTEDIDHVVREVARELHDGLTTKEIYRHAFSVLKKKETTAANRYSLRRALFDLGPTGFPFERFLAQVFEYEGYIVEVGAELKGACATHELDLVAFKKDNCFIAEAKFHVRPGIKSDLQDALYSYARFLDLKGVQPHAEFCSVKEGMVITNTKFTRTATDYAECVGLSLLSWNYPKEHNLQKRVEDSGLYPVTVLSCLSKSEKKRLLEENIVLCSDLVERQRHLSSLGIPQKKIEKALEESRKLCS